MEYIVKWWNTGSNGGKTTPTNYAVSRPFPISFTFVYVMGQKPAFHEAANHSLSVTKVQSA